jgi:hypothetical protein
VHGVGVVAQQPALRARVAHLAAGAERRCARRKNSVMPTIIMATESSSPEVLPISVTSPKPGLMPSRHPAFRGD